MNQRISTRKHARALRCLAAAALVATAAALALAGCGGSSGGSAQGAGSPGGGTPKKGGTITLTYQSEPSSLDPAVAWNVIDWNVEHAIFQSFFRYAAKPGAAGAQLEPCLATQVPTVANGGISADGKTITIHLRSGVKFQPPVNRVVTAADFKYSFERMLRSPWRPAPASTWACRARRPTTTRRRTRSRASRPSTRAPCASSWSARTCRS